MTSECHSPPVSPMVCMMAAEPPPESHGTAVGTGSSPRMLGREKLTPHTRTHGRAHHWQRGVLLVEKGLGANMAEVMPAPKGMTPAEWARHCITHLPYCSNCPWRVASRRPNCPHRRSNNSERVSPLLVADYCFLKGSTDDDHITVLVMRLYPYRVFV